MNIDQIQKTLQFVNVCKRLEVNNTSEVVSRVLKMLDKVREVKEKHQKQKKEIPFSLLNIVGARELENSSILKEFLSINRMGRYEILESFIQCFFGDRFNHKIKEPKFSNEEHRIDILIKDRDYSIIFENKIWGAGDQNNQLARYIMAMENEGYLQEQIYVVYLPLDDHEPSECSWIKPQMCCKKCNGKSKEQCSNFYSYKDNFVDRYFRLSFGSDILHWITNELIPDCQVRDLQLYSALLQYKTYLENISGFDELNDTEKMEIKNQIKELLNFTDNDFENHQLVVKQLRDLKTVAQQLEALELEMLDNCSDKVIDELKAEFPDYTVYKRPDKHWYYVGVEFPFRGKLYKVGLEENVSAKVVYYGLIPPSNKKVADVHDEIADIVTHFKNQGKFYSSAGWACYKYIKYKDGAAAVKEMVKYCKEHENDNRV